MRTEPNDPISPSGNRHGLNKREYFTAMALQGILSNPAHNNNSIMGVNGDGVQGFIESKLASQESVRCADALIAALNEKEA